jgi:poly(A) polymerase
VTRKAIPAHARAAALAIVRTLRAQGHAAYLAGGCVRDELLGLAPTDYDIATDATPDRIRSLFKRTAEVGAAFGVVLVTPGTEEGAPDLPRGERATVEVATFRSEGPYSDRRRPDSVTFSDAKSDALRRDFTLNALFLDPLEGERGRVIDYVGGVQDLERRMLRAVGNADERLAEDHLRALRAVRLAARLSLAIEPATGEAIHRHARELAGVSRERIGEEVRRMLMHASRARAAALLEELGLDAPVLEEPAQRSSGVHLSFAATDHGDETSLYPRHLAAWALDRGLKASARDIEDLLRRWRGALCLSNEERTGIGAILRGLNLLRDRWEGLGVSAQKRAIGAGGARFQHALDLLDATDSARCGEIRARIAALSATPSGICPEPLLTGDDLVAMGMKPGPRFKSVLDRVYDAQLEDRIRTPGEARELGRTLSV